MPIQRFTILPNHSRTAVSLNGKWRIAGGNADAPPEVFPSSITVPSVVDIADPPYDWQSFNYHWYKKTFPVGKIPTSKNIFLKFDQSMFGTEVWVNGHHAGGSISCYTSHEYRITHLLRPGKTNYIIARIGAKSTLPPESAVGKDQEKEIYTPGIWGDVTLFSTGCARVKRVQVIPQIDAATAEVRAWIENCTEEKLSLTVSATIVKKSSGKKVSPQKKCSVQVNPFETESVTLHLPIASVSLWSPEHPFLYESVVNVLAGKRELDRVRTTFGMREFKIVGPDFYLNGNKIFLRGGNIAFHRFLSDPQRKLLPWDERWIKKALIDIPKEHHFNFFRNHLGQLYNRWYDIADEKGMLIQNEWHFWGVTGTKAQITKEFNEWLQDNWNHPSIVIWDPLNESSDDVVQNEIVPAMKQLDPTRPWESVDFLEEHPYVYSLGMVLNDRKFGFTRSMKEIESLPVPSMLNEFLWWWLNDRWEPTVLTKMIVQRWLGREHTKEELIAHQSFLAQELIELFRRMKVKAIQPFVYISNNDGPTAHWFIGDIKELTPKPLMKAIKNAFAPFGVSIELWDRHFFAKERYPVRVFIFNDTQSMKRGVLHYGLKMSDGQWMFRKEILVEVPPVSTKILEEQFMLPNALDHYRVTAELHEGTSIVAHSAKVTYPFYDKPLKNLPAAIYISDSSKEIDRFFQERGIAFKKLEKANLEGNGIIILHGALTDHPAVTTRKKEVDAFVKQGGMLVLIEPEFQVTGTVRLPIVEGIDLIMTQRNDIDKGGYDSYVFAEDLSHPIWDRIEKEYLMMFNGAYGGEAVSEHDVEFSVPSKRLASCGIDLKINAASEVDYGKGKILLFRIQMRERLMPMQKQNTIFDRRKDPVSRNLLINILSYAQSLGC